ncbi:MAG: hypothetical protein II877_05900, partial [Synergistaceae bacterium]|nr:hypothetical protein [Synergistaceae bacterium]
MRKILLSLAALLVMSGVSSADFVYSTSAGHLGTVKVAASFDIEAPSVKYTGNHSSPFLTSYWNGSGTSLALIDRNAGTSGDMAYVFSPGGLENFTYSADIEGVYGTSAAGYAESGYSLFLTTGSMLYEVNVNSFSVMNSFDCTRIISDEVYPTEIESIAVDSSLIHIIASAGNARRYMRFEGQLDDTKYSFLSADIPDGAS